MNGSCCLCSVVQGDEYFGDAQWCSHSGFLLFPCLTICNDAMCLYGVLMLISFNFCLTQNLLV